MTRWIVGLVALSAFGCDDSRGQCAPDPDGGGCEEPAFAASYAIWSGYDCEGEADCVSDAHEAVSDSTWRVACLREMRDGTLSLSAHSPMMGDFDGFAYFVGGFNPGSLEPQADALVSVPYVGVLRNSAECQLAVTRDGDDFTAIVSCIGEIDGTDPPGTEFPNGRIFVGGPDGSTDPMVLTWTNCPLD